MILNDAADVFTLRSCDLLVYLMVTVLFGHDFNDFHLHVSDVLLVFVLVMLHLLQMGDLKSILRLHHTLHLRVEVLDLGFELLDLFVRFHIEIVGHVLPKLYLLGIILVLGQGWHVS